MQTAEIEEEIVEVVEDTYGADRERDREITYEVIEEVVHVEGVYLEKILRSTNFEDDHSVIYFQRRLRDLGVVETLKKMGTEALLKGIYHEVVEIRERLETLEEILVPSEDISKEELEEIEKLKEESLSGEHVEWERLKRELNLDV